MNRVVAGTFACICVMCMCMYRCYSPWTADKHDLRPFCLRIYFKLFHCFTSFIDSIFLSLQIKCDKMIPYLVRLMYCKINIYKLNICYPSNFIELTQSYFEMSIIVCLWYSRSVFFRRFICLQNTKPRWIAKNSKIRISACTILFLLSFHAFDKNMFGILFLFTLRIFRLLKFQFDCVRRKPWSDFSSKHFDYFEKMFQNILKMDSFFLLPGNIKIVDWKFFVFIIRKEQFAAS